MVQHRDKTMTKLRVSILTTMLLLILIPVIFYVLLFRVNTFTLEIRPRDDFQMVVSAGESYSDPGADAFLVGTFLARRGYPINVEILTQQDVNTDAPGNYTVRYSAQWMGMEAMQIRPVSVRDTTPPEITLFSIPGSYTLLGQTYQDEGYSAWDNCDGDLTAYVTRLSDGDCVTYIVMDQAGNRTSITRKIHYHDPVAPDLQLLGESVIRLKAGESYSEPGWTAVDNVDGDIGSWVKISGQVDKYRAGNYCLTYSVCDHTGNRTEAVRNVVVEARGIAETIVPEGKVIYLTFDDGPGPYTRQLLEILEKYGAKATFFVVNSKYQDVLSEIVKGGHSIGIHAKNHDYKAIYANAEAYFTDLLAMQRIIYEQTGVETYLMRFPGGSSNTVSRFNEGIMTYLTQAVEDMGFRYFDWNVDSDDAGKTKKAEKVFDNVIAGVEVRRISIVLQHDVKDYSVEAVEKILIWGIENGYQFLGLDMTSPMAHHGVNN